MRCRWASGVGGRNRYSTTSYLTSYLLGPVASRENVTFHSCRSRALPPRPAATEDSAKEKGPPVSHVCPSVSLCVGATASDRKVDVTR